MRGVARAGALGAVLAAVAACAIGRSAEVGQPLSEETLRTHLFAFAADSMRGRATGTPDNDRATAWVARELRRAGLQPAGERGTFFQEVPLSRHVFDSSVTLSIGRHVLRPYVDYVPQYQGMNTRAFEGARVVYAGDPTATYAEMNATVNGDNAVVVLGASGGAHYAALAMEEFTRLYPSALALCLVDIDSTPPGFMQYLLAMPQRIRIDTTERLPAAVAVFHVTRAVAEELFGRKLAGLDTGAAGAVVRGNVRFRTVPLPARNVVAVLPGTDPTLRNEYVVLAAPNDGLGVSQAAVDADLHRASQLQERALWIAAKSWPNRGEYLDMASKVKVNKDSIRQAHPVPRMDSIANGADHGGSGTVALLEIAQAISARRERPRRSILFLSHTAAETGMFGSWWLTMHSPVPIASMTAMLNLDMIGRGGARDENDGGPDYLATVGGRRLSTELGDLLDRVSVERGYRWRVDSAYDANSHPERFYCFADHSNFARMGVPAVYLFTGLHADYHQISDEPQFEDYAKLSRVAHYAHDVVLALANRDRRPLVDKPNGTPQNLCGQ